MIGYLLSYLAGTTLSGSVPSQSTFYYTRITTLIPALRLFYLVLINKEETHLELIKLNKIDRLKLNMETLLKPEEVEKGIEEFRLIYEQKIAVSSNSSGFKMLKDKTYRKIFIQSCIFASC